MKSQLLILIDIWDCDTLLGVLIGPLVDQPLQAIQQLQELLLPVPIIVTSVGFERRASPIVFALFTSDLLDSWELKQGKLLAKLSPVGTQLRASKGREERSFRVSVGSSQRVSSGTPHHLLCCSRFLLTLSLTSTPMTFMMHANLLRVSMSPSLGPVTVCVANSILHKT